jgi:hypothetical protein
MKQLLTAIIVLMGLSGCNNDAPQLKKPIILVAKHKADKDRFGTIVLKDADNFYWSGSAYNNNFVMAVVDSYNVGDTLK